MARRRITKLRLLGFAVALLVLSSCGTIKFYTQAFRGQMEILRRAEPVEEVLGKPGLDDKLRSRLLLVQKLREFAKNDLRLPAEGQYDRYSDLGRKHVVWVVFAAPEFSIEAKTWWYPLVGSLKYRGFFNETDAKAEGDKLKARGLDVLVGGVDAYSTLGWFRDPVLNTFIHRDDAELAELIFHELTHQMLYISGDTDFNEAFATANGQEGVRRWLRSCGRTADLRRYENDLRANDEFIELAVATRQELESLYERHKDESPEVLRKLKADQFARFRDAATGIEARWGGAHEIDRWFSKPVNNARLNTLTTYHEQVRGFERLLREQSGDLLKFHAAVKSMEPLGKDERRRKLMQEDMR